jgi:hypothetical protein
MRQLWVEGFVSEALRSHIEMAPIKYPTEPNSDRR